MTYARVIPRDLFNEASLLKCLGKLWLELENLREHKASLHHDGAAFRIEQSPSDGSISCDNVQLTISGVTYHLFRPLNSRDDWPLWIMADDEDMLIFDNDGNLSAEFIALITE